MPPNLAPFVLAFGVQRDHSMGWRKREKRREKNNIGSKGHIINVREYVQRSATAFLGLCYCLWDARVARRTIRPPPLQTFKGMDLCMDRGRGLWANTAGQLHRKKFNILWWPPDRLPKSAFDSWRPHVHKTHIESTSSSRSKIQYIRSL